MFCFVQQIHPTIHSKTDSTIKFASLSASHRIHLIHSDHVAWMSLALIVGVHHPHLEKGIGADREKDR